MRTYQRGRKYQRWSPAEDAILHEVFAEAGWRGCQELLPGRTKWTIKQRGSKLGLTKRRATGSQSVTKPSSDKKHEIKTRACLKCREKFISEWPGERICTGCRDSVVWREQVSEPISTGRKVGPRGHGAEG